MDVTSVFKSARESLWPVLTSSAFLERGVLTPEEFVKAGDHLVHSCRTWSWETGDESKIKSYLPRDKQYLSIKKVPSHKRASSLLSASINENVIEGDEKAGGDWASTEFCEQSGNAMSAEEDVLVELSEANPEMKTTETSINDAVPTDTNTSNTSKPAKEDEYLDMDFEDDSLALDALAVSEPSTSTSIVYSRRYDVSITYDKYWQTPRIWLFGYDEKNNPLPPVSIFDDIMQDYAKKTVTIETHPHLDSPHASIHPCQHAAAMLRIINALSDCGKVPTVEQYMFIFLKFMQSVMPTIEYDYTFDVQVRDNK